MVKWEFDQWSNGNLTRVKWEFDQGSNGSLITLVEWELTSCQIAGSALTSDQTYFQCQKDLTTAYFDWLF